MTAELIHRLHFAFTITFHYLFPQLTMGLALLIVVLKSVALKTGSEKWDRAARFWGRIFGTPILSSAWSPAFPWSSSSARTGRASPVSPAA
jgi:cytochrome d ubiquinol oxidase subunit I